MKVQLALPVTLSRRTLASLLRERAESNCREYRMSTGVGRYLSDRTNRLLHKPGIDGNSLTAS
jgi:hypothetical protein